MNRILKRVLVGRPISSHEEAHHRLPKRIALAVFSSDALSSSAYATDEVLLALVIGGAAAMQFAVPIGLGVAVVLGVVIISYRQTVRAYPQGGGAYIVAHENLGKYPGLIAAGALLVDYILTVAVSVAAGMAAVGAAFPQFRENRLGGALLIVGLITFLNLRGLKESGTIFAVPTYGFLISMGVMIAVGAYKALAGDAPAAEAAHLGSEAQTVSIFLVLRAFSSGCTALTGVEAISDGVPAFRKPEAKNAAQTLLILGFLLTFLFLGVTFLARAFGVDAHLIEEGRTVTSQIASSVFGHGSVMFFAIQSFAALILFLAANTAYADFPRLASILARDRYLPRALQNRGDRLAFSNGIIILAAAAGGILIHYKADVHKIIPLYVIGVFTSFTLSQTGMVVRWIKKAHEARRKGQPEPEKWRRSAVISGIGAFTTFIVFLIVTRSKFFAPVEPGEDPLIRGGAWQVIVMIVFLAYVLSKIRAHYENVSEELRVQGKQPSIRTNRVVLVVTRFKGSTKALAFARAIAPQQLRVVSLGASPVRITDLKNRWQSMGIKTPIEDAGTNPRDLLRTVKEMIPTEEDPVTVILPDPQYSGWVQQILKNQLLLRLKRMFLTQPNVVVISVPFNPEVEAEPTRLQAPGRLAMIVVVSSVHRATVRAVHYASSLNPSELKAMTVLTDPGEAARITSEWADPRWGLNVPLEIVDSPWRSLMEPLLREVRELSPNLSDAIGVVVPEFVVPHWWQNFLHNQTAFLIKTTLLFEPNVVVINVPYRIRGGPKKRRLKEKEDSVDFR